MKKGMFTMFAAGTDAELMRYTQHLKRMSGVGGIASRFVQDEYGHAPLILGVARRASEQGQLGQGTHVKRLPSERVRCELWGRRRQPIPIKKTGGIGHSR